MKNVLFIGLGGLGVRVLARIQKRLAQLTNDRTSVQYMAIDRDEADLEKIARGEEFPCISLFPNMPAREVLRQYHALGVEEWFPSSPTVLHSAGFSSGVRAMGRLDFIHALETGRLETLKEQLQLLISNARSWQQEEPRIVVITSLSGGTGSGSFIQLALWLRKMLREHGNIVGEICGMFAGPEVMIRAQEPTISACERCRANAYAALRELELFTKIAETGETVPGYECFRLDGLQLARNGAWPIYDRISLYEQDEKEKADYETHLERIAGNACMYLADRLPVSLSSDPWEKGLHFTAIGTAVAQYPQKELVEYCSLRGAMELAQRGFQSGEDLTEPQVDEKVKQLAKMLERQVEQEQSGFEQILEMPLPNPEQITTQEMDAFIESTMRGLWLRVRECREKNRTLPETMLRVILRDHSLVEGYARQPLFWVRGENEASRPMPVASLQEVLTKLRVTLGEIQNRQEKLLRERDDPNWLSQAPEGLGLPPFCKEVAETPGSPYPLVVWQKLLPLTKIVFGKSLKKKYMEWLSAYCCWVKNWQMELANAEIMRTMCEALIREITGLLDSIEFFNRQLEDRMCRLMDRHGQQHTAPEWVRICGDREAKERIYSQVSPYDQMEDFSVTYLQELLAIHGEKKWIDLAEKREFATAKVADACKKLLEHIRRSVIESGSRLLEMEATAALRYSGAAGGLDALCEVLRSNAQKSAAYMQGMAIGNAAKQAVLFGVAGNCEAKNELDQIIRNMNAAQLVVSRETDSSMLWCMQLRWGISLKETPMEKWAEAYRWLCERARNSGEAHFEPHMDTHWAEQIFGLQ